MKLTFWGAAQTVTGSMHEVVVDGRRYLLDCGLYQGKRAEARARNLDFPFPPRDVEAVILSHAHIDHTGNLPTLVKQGFHGPVFATPPTVDLCEAMLQDSAFLQQKDADFVNKRKARKRTLELLAEPDNPVEPLYSLTDALRAIAQLRPVPVHRIHELTGSLHYEAVEAGHMLGSTSLVLRHGNGSRQIRLGFSGDVGRRNLPIIRDPETLPPVDYLILESTYGGRLHKADTVVSDKLANVINRTAQRGGKIVVPAFAVGRTQQLVVLLHELTLAGRIPELPIFVDSPLAINATEVFRKHRECFDEDTQSLLERDGDPFGFARLRYVREVEGSKALNDLSGPVVIISASGMCEAGRVLHHLWNNIEDSRNTVLITGFQAENTLGRKLVDKLPEVQIFGEPKKLRAEVVTINELSAHADQLELLTWLKPLVQDLRAVFLVHGEPLQQEALAQAIRNLYNLEVHIPRRGDSFEL